MKDYIHNLINLKDSETREQMGVDPYELMDCTEKDLHDLAKSPIFDYWSKDYLLFMTNLFEVSDRSMTKERRKEAEHQIRFENYCQEQIAESEQYSLGRNI